MGVPPTAGAVSPAVVVVGVTNGAAPSFTAIEPLPYGYPRTAAARTGAGSGHVNSSRVGGVSRAVLAGGQAGRRQAGGRSVAHPAVGVHGSTQAEGSRPAPQPLTRVVCQAGSRRGPHGAHSIDVVERRGCQAGGAPPWHADRKYSPHLAPKPLCSGVGDGKAAPGCIDGTLLIAVFGQLEASHLGACRQGRACRQEAS